MYLKRVVESLLLLTFCFCLLPWVIYFLFIYLIFLLFIGVGDVDGPVKMTGWPWGSQDVKTLFGWWSQRNVDSYQALWDATRLNAHIPQVKLKYPTNFCPTRFHNTTTSNAFPTDHINLNSNPISMNLRHTQADQAKRGEQQTNKQAPSGNHSFRIDRQCSLVYPRERSEPK